MQIMQRMYESRDLLNTTEPSGEKQRTTLQFTKDMLSRTSNVLKEVPIIGVTDNANGKRYSRELLENKDTIKEYEGVKVFINHVKEEIGEHHGSEDLFGEIGNVRFVEKKDHLGLVGDITFNPKHPMAEAFAWWYDTKPTVLGLSHDACIVVDQLTKDVKAIKKVYSVDIVHNPASTKSLRATEGIVEDKYLSDKAKREIFDLSNTGVEMFFNALWGNTDDNTRATECIKILDDLRSTLVKFQTKPQEGKTMEYKDITIDGLKQNRKDLLQTIETVAVEAHRATEAKIQEAVKGIPEKYRTRLFMEGIRNAIVSGVDPKEIVSDQLSLVSEDASKKQNSTETTAPTSHGVVRSSESKKEEKKKEEFTMDTLLKLKG